MIDDGIVRPGPEHREIARGAASGRLIREVRSVLWRHLRCRPHRGDQCWRLAWEWAEACATRNARWLKKSRRWPSPSEIASQYLLLVLAEMRESHTLRLPMYAAECMPPGVVQRLTRQDAPRLLQYNLENKEPSDAIQRTAQEQHDPISRDA